MPKLADVLSRNPELTWRIGRVEWVDYDSGTATVVLGDVGDPSDSVMRYARVAFFQSYVPQVYDVVHLLHQEGIGAVIIGGAKMSGVIPPSTGGGDGTMWFTGDGPPADPFPGADPGDLYLDNLTGDYYRLNQ
jgi:hypothetical protein